MLIRPEHPSDIPAIRSITTQAFALARHSSGTEAAIVDALRDADALTLSLVAEDAGEVVGHIAFSPVTIDGASIGWFGLGPVAVRCDRQRDGIGSALIRAGLEQLKDRGAAGCVLLGDPGFYARFGFESDPMLRFGNVPPAYFQRLVFGPDHAAGIVAFHAAFDN